MCAFPKLFNTFDKSFIFQFLASEKGMTVTGIPGPYESHNRSGWKPKHQVPGFAVPRWKVSTVKITVLGALNAWADVKIVCVSVVSFLSVNGTTVDQIFASCLVGICVSLLDFLIWGFKCYNKPAQVSILHLVLCFQSFVPAKRLSLNIIFFRSDIPINIFIYLFI